MNSNNISKAFLDSASWIDPGVVDFLSEQGLIQRIPSEDAGKYALTFKGIVQAVRMKHTITLEEQFLRFLQMADQKFSTGEQATFDWDEKLASLSLLLMTSTSEASAVRLNNQNNKTVLSQVFDDTLTCLKKYSIVSADERLRTKSRDESPVSALMSRLNKLARKTNHYYVNLREESGYFFDIEKKGEVDEKRLMFLFRRIFESASKDRDDYGEMYKELADISQHYSSRFLGRSTSLDISLSILKRFKDFIDMEIWRLPHPISTKQM